MSDYTAPNKSVGQTWTADEHNDLKIAVNSKMDKSNLKNDLTAPSSTTFPSTQLLSAVLGLAMTYRGSIDGLSNLNECLNPGYFTSSVSGTGDWHASFPETSPESLCRVGLLVYSTQSFINQELTFYLNRPRVFKRILSDGVWSNWVEYMTVTEGGDTYAPVVPDGIPTVYFDSFSDGYSISLSEGSRDVGGKVTIYNGSANPLPLLTFKIEFQKPRPTILSAFLIAANNFAKTETIEVMEVTEAVLKFGISCSISIGQSLSFYYGVCLNQ